MTILVTSLYAGLLGIIYVALAAAVGRMRGVKNVALGDNGDPELSVAIRRHANFGEWVPLAIVLMALVEINGGAKWWVHALGTVLLLARAAHPFGLETKRLFTVPRIIGAAGTIFVVAGAAITLLWQYFQSGI